MDPDDLGAFYSRIWDLWFPKDVGYREVTLFDTTVSQAMGGPSQDCIHNSFCGKNMASVESNGDVYSCEYYVYPDFRLGNLLQRPLGEMAYSPQQMSFGLSKRESLTQYCRRCEYLKLCWGECPRTRVLRAPDGEPGLSYFCTGMKRFYAHIQKDLPVIIRSIQKANAAQGTPAKPQP